jgi:hypothetical protein
MSTLWGSRNSIRIMVHRLMSITCRSEVSTPDNSGKNPISCVYNGFSSERAGVTGNDGGHRGGQQRKE